MRDTRLVQTAVLKHPKSDDPVLMPMERWDALALRAALAKRSLWCGHLLGGCGRQLTTRIGRQRVPHFAHFPNADGSPSVCGRAHTDASSADHLFINIGINDLLGRHDRRPAQVRFDGEFDTGGTCHWITVDLPDGGGTVVVALRGADLSEWEEHDERLRSSSRWVSWLFGPGLRAPQRLLQRDGYVMHLLFDDRRADRPLRLGTQLVHAPTDWIDFGDARIGDAGLVTPASSHARRADRTPPTAPTPEPVPVSPYPPERADPPYVSVAPIETPAPAPMPPSAEAADPPELPDTPAITAPARPQRRTMLLDNGIELPLPELRMLLGRIAQRYGFAENVTQARIVAEWARSLSSITGDRAELPMWLLHDIATALGVEGRRSDALTRPLDPGPTVDHLPLPDRVVAVLTDLGWDHTSDELRTRWVKVACTHRSYLYEHREVGVDPRVLDMLQEVGKRWLGLAILDCFTAQYRARSAGEQSQVIANLRHTLFELLGTESALAGHLLLGHGEALLMQDSEYRAKARVDVDGVLQICGAVALLGGIDALHELARRWYPQVTDSVRDADGAADSVDWKSALNELRVAVVFETSASRPDHDKQFTTTARDDGGRTGRGSGRSKKAAERAAAEDFIRTNTPREADRLIASARTTFQYQAPLHPRSFPRGQFSAQWRAIDGARNLFGLPPSADAYLTQALTHSSWAYENQAAVARANQRDNTVLAHHGSVVVDALCAHRRAGYVLASTLIPSPDDARIMTPVESVWRDAFAETSLSSGLFLGRGEQAHPIRSYANALQAVLAVAWRFRGQDLVNDLPSALVTHVDRANDGSVDRYTRLLESCRHFGLEFTDTYDVTGPDHGRSFTCTMHVTSPSGQITVAGPPAPSKSLSKQACASRLLDVVETISRGDEWDLDADDSAIAEFLLRAQLTGFPHVKRGQLPRLIGRGALGTTYLVTGDVDAFGDWAQQVEELIGGGTGELAEALRRFYLQCLTEAGGDTETRKPLRVALAHLRRQAREGDMSAVDRDLLDAVCRVIRVGLERGDTGTAAVSETLQWIVVAADRCGGSARVHQEPHGFNLTISNAEPGTLLDPLVPLMEAQVPSLTVVPSDHTIVIGREPLSGARSILQAGAMALGESSSTVGQRLYEAVCLLRTAVTAGDPESIETAVADLDRNLRP